MDRERVTLERLRPDDPVRGAGRRRGEPRRVVAMGTGLGLRLGERTGLVDQPRMRRWVDLPSALTRRGRTVRATVPGAEWTMRLERLGVAVVRRAGVPIAEVRGGLARDVRLAPGVTSDEVALVTCLGVSCFGPLSLLNDLS